MASASPGGCTALASPGAQDTTSAFASKQGTETELGWV